MTAIPTIPDDIAESVSRLCEILNVPGLSPELKRSIDTVRYLVEDQQGNVGIERLDLPVRPYNNLKRHNVHTVRELAGKTCWDLLDMRNFGAGSYISTFTALEAYARAHGPIQHVEPEYMPSGDHCMGCVTNRLSERGPK